MSNNTCEQVPNKGHTNTQDSQPVGVATFEDVISKFNGKPADKYDKKILLLQSILGALVVILWQKCLMAGFLGLVILAVYRIQRSTVTTVGHATQWLILMI